MTAPPAGALEACPFCGREAHLTFDKAFGGFVSCSTEGCAGNAHAAQHDRSQIIAAWNRRTHGPALLAALRLREWRPIAEAPVSTPLEQVHFLAYCPDDDWGPLGKVHVACRYDGFSTATVRPIGTNGGRRALAWKPCAPPTAAAPAAPKGGVADEAMTQAAFDKFRFHRSHGAGEREAIYAALTAALATKEQRP